MKKLTGILLALALAVSLSVPAFAYSSHDASSVAQGLKTLGLFLGGGSGFELDRQPTRAEAVVMLLRLLGSKDGDLKAYPAGRCPFSDVPDWAKGYVAYAWDNGLAAGVGGSRFGAGSPATAQMFSAFVLRSLGYSDDTRGGTDFTYAKAVSFAVEKGLLGSEADAQNFNRGVCVKMMEAALDGQTKDGAAMWQKLVQRGVFTEAQYREAVELAKAPPEPDWRAVAPGAPAYQSLYPDFYAPQPFNATEVAKNTIYLTFDDGPSARTDEILATLAEKNVKATFFVIGHSDDASFDRMRKIVDQGHTIGMHSYTHQYKKIYASVDAFLDDFYQNFTQIREVTGVTPTVFRFPGGSINSYNKRVYKEIKTEMERRGFVPYDWNISSGDATSGGATVNEVYGNIVNQAKSKTRGIVLCHDSAPKRTTSQALGSVIDALRGMGFSFAPLSPTVKPILF